MPLTRENKTDRRAGFSLIELLVAMTLMAVVAAISLSSFDGAKRAGRDTKRRADLEQIRSVLEMYRNDCREYPAVVDFGGSLVGESGLTCAGERYLEKVPEDALSPTFGYYYERTGVNSYNLCARLENTEGTVGCGSCGDEGCNYLLTNP